VAFLPGVGSVSTTKHFSSEDLTIHRSATTGVGVKVAMNRRVAASRDLKFVIIGNASWLQSLNKRVRELFIPAMFRKVPMEVSDESAHAGLACGSNPN